MKEAIIAKQGQRKLPKSWRKEGATKVAPKKSQWEAAEYTLRDPLSQMLRDSGWNQSK